MMDVLQLVIHKNLLVNRVNLHLDHVANALVDHQLLMRLQVLLVVRNLSDELIYIGFLL
jgi:hypothetical protein